MNNWSKKIKSLQEILLKLSFQKGKQELISVNNGFKKLKTLTQIIKNNHKTIYVIGNGASASMASHFAADLAKNGKLHTEVFSDLALITAISNDLGYGNVFAEPLRRRGKAGDMLVAISSSGNSPNIIEAIRIAQKLKMNVVTLTAMEKSNPVRKLGTLNLHLPAKTYGEAETVHATVLHYWIDLIVEQGTTNQHLSQTK